MRKLWAVSLKLGASLAVIVLWSALASAPAFAQPQDASQVTQTFGDGSEWVEAMVYWYSEGFSYTVDIASFTVPGAMSPAYLDCSCNSQPSVGTEGYWSFQDWLISNIGGQYTYELDWEAYVPAWQQVSCSSCCDSGENQGETQCYSYYGIVFSTDYSFSGM